MFVIVQAWDNHASSSVDSSIPLHVRVASMLRHAGVSITITSATDVVAFGIGATTVSKFNIENNTICGNILFGK